MSKLVFDVSFNSQCHIETGLQHLSLVGVKHIHVLLIYMFLYLNYKIQIYVQIDNIEHGDM